MRVFWLISATFFFTAGILLLTSCSQGEVGCDELLDRVVEAKIAFRQSDSIIDFNDWRVAARAYCGECVDPRLCTGTVPK